MTLTPQIVFIERHYWQAMVTDAGPYAVTFDNLTDASPSYAVDEAEFIGAHQLFALASFADSGVMGISKHLLLPADWYSGGGIDIRLVWYTGATSGNVVWQLQTAFAAAGADPDPAFNTAQTITQAANGTANRVILASLTGLTLTGAAASSLMFLKIFRDPGNAGDTLGAEASLIGVELTLRRLITITG